MTCPVMLRRIGWIGLTLIGVLPLFASINNMLSDHADGLPSDHTNAVANLAGNAFSTVSTFSTVKASTPGTARYVTDLEYGYALHELTFGLLFLALVLIPFRRGAGGCISVTGRG